MLAIKDFFAVFFNKRVSFFFFAEDDDYFNFVVGFCIDWFLVSAAELCLDVENISVLC